MSKLTRFGISLEGPLLKQFDQLIHKKGYSNRSEALRDLIREKIVIEKTEYDDTELFGSLMYIYDHHKRELEKSLSNIQHKHYGNIIASTHVHIDHDNCLEVILLRGKAAELKSLAERLLSFNGVKNGKLSLTAPLLKRRN